MENKKISLLLLLDLSKAFDSVNHEILLRKCEMLNIDTAWFQNYLSNRHQIVKIKNTTSSSRAVSFGVPQGSILGPILFIIFVNDLVKYLPQCYIVQYADDTQILLEGDISDLNGLIERANNILTLAKVYFQINGLLLNTDKTQCIFIGSRQYINRIDPNVTINFNGNQIKPLSSVKNLGVVFDKYMTFETHIDMIHRKVMGTLIYLNRVKNCFLPQTRLTVIQSLALSIINYCFTVWGSASAMHLNKAQKLQNFAARVALGTVSKYEHITPFLIQLGWLKLKEKYKYDICILVFKIIRGLIPDWLYNLETVNSITRQAENLSERRVRTEMGSREVSVRGPHLWNSLPVSLRETPTLPPFKTKLKKHLLSDI